MRTIRNNKMEINTTVSLGNERIDKLSLDVHIEKQLWFIDQPMGVFVTEVSAKFLITKAEPAFGDFPAWQNEPGLNTWRQFWMENS